MLSREVRYAANLLMPLVAGGLFFLTGCPSDTPPTKKSATTTSPAAHGHDDGDHHNHEGHHHAEQGPHSGALVAIGDDDAHLEFVLDADTGKLTAYVLDGAAEKPVPIKQAKLQLTYSLTKASEGEEAKDDLPDDAPILTMEAVSPADDGTTTEFSGQADDLKGAEKFTAVLTTVNVGSKSFKNVNFKYPEGNEEDHHH